MENQLRSLGTSCDWTRNKFTLDPDIVEVVYRTFKKLSDEGYLYRAYKLVNYCTRCGTAYSELEVDHVERKDPLYYMKYGPFVLATVRPETKFGDTAVAVNPKDKRYKKYIGKEIEVEGLIGKFKVKVIADREVDMEFGTGVVKVTPAHDFNDYEMAGRHNLELKQVIGFDGRLNDKCGKYEGLKVAEARKVVVNDLIQNGLMEKVDENYTHAVGACYRCKTIIEPLPFEQWFVEVKKLAQEAKKAVVGGKTKFANKRFEKIYFHWLDNLKDWNISRQIVWGIQIPAWKCDECGEWTITEGETPAQGKCGHNNLTRDEDTFDTWFSSGQWPFATLQTTKTGDFEKYYPTSVMETAYDILPFWVMRMMMFGIYVTGQVPFKNILIHGLVRDKNGTKISKSKGNVINPIEMTEKYGTDAVRAAITWGTLVENDIALSEENIRGQKYFANKIWNMGRFIEMSFTKNNLKLIEFANIKNISTEEDLEVLGQLKKTIKLVTKDIEKYRLSEALAKEYEFIWHQVADIYIEKLKNRSDSEISFNILRYVYLSCLKLLHPFMPFVTEAIWQELKRNKLVSEETDLISAKWPELT